MFCAQWAAEWPGSLLKSAGHPQLLQQISEPWCRGQAPPLLTEIEAQDQYIQFEAQIIQDSSLAWFLCLMGGGRGLGTKVIFNYDSSSLFI